MGGHQADVAEQGARRASCGRSTLGAAIRRTMARDLPDCYGLCTTCYNRFVRWRIMDALAAAHDAAVQMIDTSMCACISTPPALLETEDNRWVGHEAD
jgi:hypothetical protein